MYISPQSKPNPYIPNAMLLLAMSTMGIGIFYRRKINLYEKIFLSLEKCQKYQLDYLPNISDLPTHKKIILFGTAKSINNDKVILRSFVKKKDVSDRFWRAKFQSEFGLGEQILVKPDQKIVSNELYVFNLLKLSDNGKHEERVVHHNEPICLFGYLEKPTTTTENASQQPSKPIFYPQIMMGTNHERIMTFLDEQMIKNGEKGRLMFTIGVAILIFHAVYNYAIGRSYLDKTGNKEVLQQIVKQKL